MNENEILEQVRSALAQIKVPGAEDAGMETTWADLDEVERIDVQVLPGGLHPGILGAGNLDLPKCSAHLLQDLVLVHRCSFHAPSAPSTARVLPLT